MVRRLRILLVDALVLAALALLAMGVLRPEGAGVATAEAAEDAAPLPIVPARAEALLDTLPPAHLIVSARVVAEASNHLILPGDHVNLHRQGAAVPAIEGARILAIDPPLSQDDPRIHVTFALPMDTARVLKHLRETELLEARLAAIGEASARGGFGPPRPVDVIVRRFDESGWEHRLAAE